MDIEAINDEHNTITRLSEGVEVDGDFGLVKYDGDDVEVWLEATSYELITITLDEAMKLGAALLEITKEHK